MKKFDTVFRGYDKYQVQRFLDDVIKNYEALLNKSKKTEEENKKLIEQIVYYQRIEETMNRAIYNAENAGDQIKSTARKEAETLITQARHNANRIIERKTKQILILFKSNFILYLLGYIAEKH